MPYHGLASFGQLTVGAKTIAIAYDGDAGENRQGTTKLVRHPAATGATRTPAQLAHDAANGLDWRDYALLCGQDHSLGGGPELGANRWLYCDSAGATWLVRLSAVDNGATVTLELWLDEIFGRIGRDWPFTPRLLASLVWAPVIPSWYGGAVTVDQVIDQLNIINPAFAPNRRLIVDCNADGSSCWVNVTCDDQTISGQVYFETQPFQNGSGFDGNALVGTIHATISGVGDLQNDGAGITGAIVSDLAFEGGLVTSRTDIVNGSQGVEAWTLTPGPIPDPPSPGLVVGDSATTWPLVWTLNNTGDNSGYFGRIERSHTAILLKTHQGVVTRTLLRQSTDSEWSISLSNTITYSYNLINDNNAGPLTFNFGSGFHENWYTSSCSTSGAMQRTLIDRDTDRVQVSYNVFGQVVSHTYERILEQTTVEWLPVDYPAGLLHVCPGYSPGIQSSNSVETFELDGQTLDGAANIWHEFRHVAPRCHYLVTAVPQTTVANWNMIERIYALPESGGVSLGWSGVTAFPAIGAGRRIPDDRELAITYQPVTDQLAHAGITLFTLLADDLVQYF